LLLNIFILKFLKRHNTNEPIVDIQKAYLCKAKLRSFRESHEKYLRLNYLKSLPGSIYRTVIQFF